MEFDSEEEREIFGRDDEDEEMESEFSSDEEEDGFLNEISSKDTISNTKDKESERQEVAPMRAEVKPRPLPNRLSSTSSGTGTSESATPSATPSDITEKDFFNDNGDSFIDAASHFLTTRPDPSPSHGDGGDIDNNEGDRAESSDSLEDEEQPSNNSSEDSEVEVGVVKDTHIQSSTSDDDTDITMATDVDLVTPKDSSVQKPHHHSNKPSAKKHRRRCGECRACLVETDCGVCRFCRDMKKYGGPNKLRQKCIQRQCVKLSRVLYTEDPLLISHGEEARLQEDIKSELERVSTLPARSEGKGAGPHGPSAAGGRSKSSDTTAAIIAHSLQQQQSKPTAKPSKKPLTKKPSKKQQPPSSEQHSKRKMPSKRQRSGHYVEESDSDDGNLYHARSTRRRPLSESWSQGVKSSSRGGSHQRQCEGPECVYVARPHSKYCSDECGILLAQRYSHRTLHYRPHYGACYIIITIISLL